MTSHGLDVVCHFGEIIVELVIATRQTSDRRVWKGRRGQLDVRKRHRLIVVALIEEEGWAVAKGGGRLSRQSQVIAWPTAFADEGRRNQKDAREPSLHGGAGQVVHQDRRTDRMSHQEYTVAESFQFTRDGLLPSGGIGL